MPTLEFLFLTRLCLLPVQTLRILPVVVLAIAVVVVVAVLVAVAETVAQLAAHSMLAALKVLRYHLDLLAYQPPAAILAAIED